MNVLTKYPMTLTIHEAQELEHMGYTCKLIALGASDKDFYDVFVRQERVI